MISTQEWNRTQTYIQELKQKIAELEEKVRSLGGQVEETTQEEQ